MHYSLTVFGTAAALALAAACGPPESRLVGLTPLPDDQPSASGGKGGTTGAGGQAGKASHGGGGAASSGSGGAGGKASGTGGTAMTGGSASQGGGRPGSTPGAGGAGPTPEMAADDALGKMYPLVNADFTKGDDYDALLFKRWNGSGSAALSNGWLKIQSGFSGDFGSPADQGPCVLGHADDSLGDRFQIDIRFKASPGAQAITMRLQAIEAESYKYMLLVGAGQLQTIYWQGQAALNSAGRGTFPLSGATGDGIYVRILHEGWKVSWQASKNGGASYETFDSLNLFGDHRWVGLCDSNTTSGPTEFASITVTKLP